VAEVRRMERHLDRLELRHVPRKENTEADELSRLASSLPPRVFKEKLCQPTVMATDRVEGGTAPLNGGNQAMPHTGNTVLPISPQEPSWMDDIRGFLKEISFPRMMRPRNGSHDSPSATQW
jgi:hypothetical protein